ncbi:NAD(P)-dependent oxidoreductase [Mycolicibacterium fortuitum]|uniref:NAD(P)-dependent oxidoreductase n=1 Tax=Mycolicibacterium fortuitum TaxID=1766 RepID=UPI001CE1A927|nr:NAD(P)-dependent oxidoreductase [Mycolicibacterium fortuitum]MCA4727280.1 NAD(P)-dependent oxidoreductase [Mycolicibacterium fortuitum]
MKVTVIGTGTMGTGMAHSLVRAGHDVTVWNRTIERARPLEASGAIVVPAIADAVCDAEAVVTMLYDGDAVVGVADALLAALRSDAVWIQSATIGVEAIAEVNRLAMAQNVELLDAPMLGTKQPAEDGELVPLVAGPLQTVTRVRPVLEAVGSRTVYAGGRIGMGTALKLACNAWIAAITAAVGQSIGLAGALGVEPALFLQAIEGGQPDSPYAHIKGAEMLSGNYPTSFAVDGLLKDLNLMIGAASSVKFPQTLLRSLRDLYSDASTHGHGHDDVAAVYSEFVDSKPLQSV